MMDACMLKPQNGAFNLRQSAAADIIPMAQADPAHKILAIVFYELIVKEKK